MLLTPRWYPLRHHPEQERLVKSKARFKVVPAGRRSGKTERAKRNLVEQALEESLEGKWEDYRYFAAAPTRDQAKAIFWEDLKALVHPDLRLKEPRESDLMIQLATGAEIWVLGMDKPQRIEGRSWNGGVLDEYANMKMTAWGENVRPALSDRGGWAWLTGVPEGRNHYYDITKRAQGDDSGEWDVFHWKSADILPAAEVESARRDLDELTFQQEYEASFVSFEGRAYYVFSDTIHTGKTTYNERDNLFFCFDFNVAPGVAGVIQEQKLPNGNQGTAVISEVYIERNSTTPAVCNKLLQDFGDHKGHIYLYGDSTGGAKGSAKLDGSDWDIIYRIMTRHYGSERVHLCVDTHNPPERKRINAMNSRLKTVAGEVRMMVDSRYCPHTIKDLEGVTLLKGGSGELDKKANPALTHISDAIGYYVASRFPVSGGDTIKRLY